MCLAFVVLALLQQENASVLVWLVVLLVGGTGIGIAMPHLSVAAMASGQQRATC